MPTLLTDEQLYARAAVARKAADHEGVKVFTGYDKQNPLQRAPGEGKNANGALWDFAQLGRKRSLRKLHALYVALNNGDADVAKNLQAFNLPEQVRTLRLPTLFGWSFRYKWQERVALWDALMQDEVQQVWLERQVQVRAADWEHGNKLRTLAAQVIEQAPSFVKETIAVEFDDKGEPYKVVTRALDVYALEKIERLASQLERLAAEMATEKTDVTSGGKPIRVVIGGVDLNDV